MIMRAEDQYTDLEAAIFNAAEWECSGLVVYSFLVTVKAASHECVIRTGQP